MFNLEILREFVEATPTAELIPIEEGKSLQSDEEEMGMTYGRVFDFQYYAMYDLHWPTN